LSGGFKPAANFEDRETVERECNSKCRPQVFVVLHNEYRPPPPTRSHNGGIPSRRKLGWKHRGLGCFAVKTR
jgi:hypothetical protein